MSFQAVLSNLTPFTAEKFVLPDREGQEVVLVVVSATFQHLDGKVGLSLAEEQTSLETADLHHGPPHVASVSRESDIALIKPRVDVLVNGCAYAPRGKTAASVRVAMEVGDVRKELLVSGDRAWRKGSLGGAATSPVPFSRMPIIYERAFGGVHAPPDDPHTHAVEARNFSGVGFRGVRSYDPNIDTDLPNVEYPDDRQNVRSDAPRPAGFGVVSRAWRPRVEFAGTYDANWLDRQWPLLPADFDPRHYQAAPLDQQSSTLRGGEPVTLQNLTAEGLWNFRLPAIDVGARLIFDGRVEDLPLRLDTVMIETETRRVVMTCRAAVRTRRNRGALREIALGHVSAGWLRARRTGKHHVALSGGDGAALLRPSYSL